MNTPKSQMLVSQLQAIWNTYKLTKSNEDRLEIENLLFRQLPQAIDEDLKEIDNDGKETSGNGTTEISQRPELRLEEIWRRAPDCVFVLQVHHIDMPTLPQAPPTAKE